jgi:hypothetical protein
MKNFDEPRTKGLHFHGGRVVVIGAALVHDDNHYTADAAIDVTIQVTALQTRNASGAVVGSTPAIPSITYRLWLDWVKSGWKVAESKHAVYR